jgi:hypothetical protein
MSVSWGSFSEKSYTLISGCMSLAVLLAAMLGPLLVDMASALGTAVAGKLATTAAAAWAVTILLVSSFSDAYGCNFIISLQKKDGLDGIPRILRNLS